MPEPEHENRGLVRVSTVSALVVLGLGFGLVATGGTVAGFVGVLFLVAAGVELALDLEQTVVPDRITSAVEPATVVPPPAAAVEGEGYEEAGAG